MFPRGNACTPDEARLQLKNRGGLALRFAYSKNKARDQRLRAHSFDMQFGRGLPDNTAKAYRIDAEFLQVTGARLAAAFDSGADGVCGAERGKGAGQETIVDRLSDSGHLLFLSLYD